MSGHILLVEDDIFALEVTSVALEKFEYFVTKAENGMLALDILFRNYNKIDLVLLDINLPKMNGLQILENIHENYPELPVIMLTGSKDINHAVSALKMGAIDFLNKPHAPEHLHVAIQNALKISNMTQEISRIKRKDRGVTNFSDIVGYNTGLRETVSVAAKTASSNIPVLISGEVGVGKEVLARSIHGESGRVLSPFVTVNCGAIPQNLIESTLFGHKKGAFTGADRKSLGKVYEAEGGTIFLDEIDELPLDIQLKLLHLLQKKEIDPVGGGEPIAVDVRIISATNKNLLDEVRDGNFREDLYFRLNVMNIIIPPLRERRQDIPLLISHFIKRFAVLEDLSIKNISPEAERLLLNYNWVGNVSELENIIHRAMVLYDGNILDTEEFSCLLENESYEVKLNKPEHEGVPYTINICNNKEIKTMEEIEKEVISLAIQFFDHNITLAAKSLNIAKSTFYRKMKQYDLS